MSKFHSDYRREEIRKIIAGPDARVHFLGVGGVGMCSLFVLSEKMGLSVSGSDRERGCYTDHLIKAGARIIVGSDPGMAASSDLLVYSLAVGEDDAELLAAEKKGVPCISRAEYLGALMQDYRVRIGVSGSHGKSTVSSMLDAIFTLAGKRPTSVIGYESVIMTF